MEITEGDIVAYIEVCSNKVSARYSIRMLMSFWYKHGVVANDFDEFFRAFKVRRKERIPSFYSSEDVVKIEESVNRNCALGKRDYAIILLASRLGLRASDISTLTFDEIDWESNLIRKKMVKTGNFIELPLLPEVGNAIIDYLKNGRPKIIVREFVHTAQTSIYHPKCLCSMQPNKQADHTQWSECHGEASWPTFTKALSCLGASKTINADRNHLRGSRPSELSVDYELSVHRHGIAPAMCT